MNAQIGYLTYALDRAPGGIGRYTGELRESLCQAGLQATILQAGQSKNYQSNMLSLPGAGYLPGLMSIGQLLIAWLTHRHGLRLIHDPTGVMPLLLTPARRVSTVHDVIPYVYPETSTALDWLIYHLWLPFAVQHLDAIITDSQQSRADIVQHLKVAPEKVTVIPCASGSHYRPLPEEQVQVTLRRYEIDFPYLLYVGSLESRKNLPRLLESFTRLRTWLPEHKLVIVGARKWKFNPIFETVQRLQLESHVHFTGYVEEEDLPALYNGAELFVFPSLYEGFGLPVLEAMACGTPVITSNSSSLPEVAGDAAILVDPYDVEMLAHAMHLVLTQPALAAALREKGLERAKEFTWERTARETIAVYEKVLGIEKLVEK